MIALAVLAGCSREVTTVSEPLPAAVPVETGVIGSGWVDAARVAVTRQGEQPSPTHQAAVSEVVDAFPSLLVASDLEGTPLGAMPITARLLAVGTREGKLFVVDTVTGKYEALAGFDGPVLVSEDQSRGSETDLVVAAAGRIWRVALGGATPTELAEALDATVLAPAVGRGRLAGGNVVAFDRGTDVVVIDADTGAELSVLPVGEELVGLAVSSWTGDVYAATSSGVRRFIAGPDGSWSAGWRAEVGGVRGLTLRPDGSAVTVWTERAVESFATGSGDRLWSSPVAGVTALAYAPDGFRLSLTTSAGVVVADPVGTPTLELTTSERTPVVRFAGTGKAVVLNEDGGLFVIDATGGLAADPTADPMDRLCALPAVRDGERAAAACS